MAYRLPTFNITINVWKNFDQSIVSPPVGAADYSCLANVAVGRRTSQFGSGYYWVLIPKGNIVYSPANVTVDPAGPSWLEIPAASGRWYLVSTCLNNALGFPNEHIAISCFPWATYPTT